MTPTASNQDLKESGNNGPASVADELQRESDKLRQLAEALKASEAAQAEMRANYPHLKQVVYASLRAKFERELAPLPDEDLERLAAAEDALPLEAFIDELDAPAE